MVKRPVVVAVICVGFFLILQSLVPKAMALKRTSGVNGFMMEDQRTHKRKNYMVQRGRNKEILGTLENVGVTFDTEPFDPSRNPAELSAFIVDYANMIRNDVILLDKSVETRTRKRGNIKVEKYNNHAIPDPPCSCEYSKDTDDLGEDVYPRFVETRNCSKGQQQTCTPPYVCMESMYNLKVLRKRTLRNTNTLENNTSFSDNLPNNIKYNWVADFSPISVGCVCTREYNIHLKNHTMNN